MTKPAYKIPSMAEIASIPWNGLNAVSTFSGCGGSCLGYRWAGFRVRWASEFIPAAREVYKLNHPDSILDARDIRQVRAEDILAATGMARGEVDLLDGSPPCSSFSMAGKREAGWGQAKPYSDTKQRTDDLFEEFARILGGVQPRAFVAENVPGLAAGAARGYCRQILALLRGHGYRVRGVVLDAQWLGVPQRRKRLFFLGIRDDQPGEIETPKPLPYRYSLADACPWIRRAVYDNSGWERNHRFQARPCPTILTSGGAHFKIEAGSSLVGYAIEPEWERLRPGESSDKYFNLIKAHPDEPSPTVTQAAGSASTAGVALPYEKRKFSIGELRRVCGFPDDFQLVGTYAKQWERLGRAVPPPVSYAVGRSVAEALCVG